MKRQPAISATSAVASREFASAMTTSASSPVAAAGTSADRVGTSVRSDSWVEMIALSMELQPRLPVATISGGRVRPPHEIKRRPDKFWAAQECSCYVHIQGLG